MKNAKLREGLLFAATVLVLLLPLALVGWYVAQKNEWAQARLAELEPRYARLLGLEAQREELTATLARAEAARTQYVYPAAQDPAQAGNAAQQKIRDIFSGAGLQIISSQVLPHKAEKGFDRVPLSVRAEGEMLALQNALTVLTSQMPVIVISELDVQVVGGVGNVSATTAPRLAVQFSLSVLREQP